MSNTLFKKVTATAAALSIVLSIVSPVVGVKAADASTEAANRLAALGVIVDSSANPSAYNLGSSITRREMLKVMMNLSSVEVSDTCEGKFSDLPKSDWGCKYAEAALKAGFIAANPKFRPNDLVTEAEALKMIMQARGVAKKEGVANWADAYAAAAIEAGILAQGAKVSTTTSAKRSMVFVSADSAVTSTTGDAAEGSDDEGMDDLFGDLFGDDEGTDATASGTTSTTASGTTSTVDNGTVVASGDLDVSLNPESASNGAQVPNKGAVRFAKVDLTAGKSDVSLNSIEVKSLGLAEVPSTTKVWFEKNGKRLSSKASFSSERTSVTSFAPSYVVKAGATETLDLYVELDTAAGNDFQFSGNVTSSSAANVKGTFTTNSLRTASYTVAPVTFNVSGSNTTANQSSDAVELARFTLANNDASSETRDVKFQSITLRQLGNADLVDLSDIILERNGAKVSTETTVSGKDVTFVVNDTVKDGGTTATYYVKAKVTSVQNNAGDTYQFTLRNDTDLNAVEVLNGFRSTVTRTTSTLNTYTVNGADVTFARDSSVELSKTYAKGSSDVVFMQGTISSKSAITLEDPTLTFNGTGSDLFSTLYLQIGSSSMSWSATATGTVKFSGVATVNGTATVKVYAKLKDTASSVNVKFNDLTLASFDKKEYVSNQNTVSSSVGSIPGVQVTVGSTVLSVTRTDGLGATKIAVGSKAVLANEIALAVTQGNDVQISNATYTITASGSYTNNVYATLYVDGVAVSSKTINAGTVTFNNLSKVISKTAAKLAVKVDFSDAYTAGDFSAQLTSLDAVDTVTSGSVTVTVPTSATLTVASAIGTLSTSDANPKASLLLAGAKDQKVLAFRVKASNDSVKLRDVMFTGTGLSDLSNFRILTPAAKYINATSNTASAVSFTNLSDTDNYVVAMDKTETFYVVADINTNVKGVANLAIALDAATSYVKSSNGTLSTLVGSNVASNVHAIEENMAVVAKAANSSKDLSTSALRFTVTASGKDSVTLSGASFDNVLSGYTGATTLTVYKDTVSAANIVGTGTVTGNVTFTANKTVDAGSTNTYIVVINGTVEASANTPSWTVRLTNLVVGSINASSYNNMGEFPITETK